MPGELHPELAKRKAEIAANLAQAESLAASLSHAQFNWRPEPGRWSIAECLSHLNVISTGDVATIRSVIAGARQRGITGSGPYRYGWFSRWFVRSMEPPVTRRFKSPKYYLPPPEADRAKTLEEYRTNAAQLTQLLDDANGLDLSRVKTPLVQPTWAKMPLGARFALLTAHDRRHLWQAGNLREHPDFPN